ncbi:hypothetical protein H9638_11450 [Arthrobacter sp. Sa2BUA2]|uniref:SCP domain-containing protein n=1 Tax=Arthrobacter pullicola TaxID=2762224 RepID=A0ABR8YJL1_9MICC|nr:CAP domain-containing protein [Arthrobacter pullicola]MBD8044420.1 hypothetical protein [Arthrobacter pullicola]
MRKLAGAFAALMLALGATAVALPAASATSLDGVAASRLHTLINDYRAQQALKPLAWNSGIAAVAQDWTMRSAQTANVHGAGTFLHNPDYAAQYPAGALGYSENIAWNMSVDQAFQWWVNSELHRGNMLGAADTDIGIGVVQLTEGPNKGVYLATVNFGQYANTAVPAPPAETLPAETTPAQTPAPEPESTVLPEPEPTRPPAETVPAVEPSAEPSAPAPEPAPGNPSADVEPEPVPTEAPAEPANPAQPAAPSETPEAPVTDPPAPVESPAPAPEEPSQAPAPVETPAPETPEPVATEETEPTAEPAATEIPAEPAGNQPAASTAGERVELQTSDPAVLTPEARGSFETRTSGSALTVSGLTPGHEYQVFLHSTPVKAGVFTVDANGILRIDIPAGLEAGDHRVALYEPNGALAGWQAFTVQAEVNVLGVATAAGPGAPAELAATGFSTGQAVFAGTGVAMILAGAAALMVLRGRRAETA